MTLISPYRRCTTRPWVAVWACVMTSLLAATVVAATATSPPPVLEYGQATLSTAPSFVFFTQTFAEPPAVICFPATSNEPEAALPIINQVNISGFSVRILESPDLDNVHVPEFAGWIAIPAGTWLLNNLTVHVDISASIGTWASTAYSVIDLPTGLFQEVPTVFAQPQTQNLNAFFHSNVRNVNTASFETALETSEETLDVQYSAETVAWVAFSRGVTNVSVGNLDLKMIISATPQEVREKWYTVTAGPDIATAPATVLMQLQTRDDPDPAFARIESYIDNNIQVTVQEDRTTGRETKHGLEIIGYAFFQPYCFNANIEVTCKSVLGSLFVDENNDGSFGAAEFVLQGVTLLLEGTSINSDVVSFSTITDVDGNYALMKVPPGDYSLCVTNGLPSGLTASAPHIGGFGGVASGTDCITGIVVPSAGTSGSGYDFVYLDTTAPQCNGPASVALVADDAGQALHTWSFNPTDNIDTSSLSASCVDTATGNPKGTSGTSEAFPCGTTNIECTANDDSGNTCTAPFSITVNDLTAPFFTSTASDQTVTGCVSSVPGPQVLSAEDNCAATPEIVSSTQRKVTTSAYCFLEEHKWVASDGTNSATHTATITVQDTLAPLMDTPPPDTTVSCLEPPIANLNANDACDGIVIPATDSLALGTDVCVHNKQRLHQWIASDACGNAVTASRTITIQDVTVPVISGVPVSTTEECSSSLLGMPTGVGATDNCDSVAPVVSGVETRVDGSCPHQYSLHRSWSTADVCGNGVTQYQTLEVQDTTAPTFDSASLPVLASTVDCTANQAAPEVTASDNCGGASVQLSTVRWSEVASGQCYVEERRWTATDSCGLSSVYVSTLTVEDTTAPTLTGVPVTAASITAECSAVPTAAVVSVTDDCDATVSVTLAESSAAGSCPSQYTLTRVWSASDVCGNTQSFVQSIAVSDNTAPVLAEPAADSTVQCVVASQSSLTASDLCGSTVTVVQDPVVFTPRVGALGTCADGTTTYSWTATDECGNSVSRSRSVTRLDTVAPVIEAVPSDVTYNTLAEICSPVAAAVLSAVDDCDSELPTSSSTVNSVTTCTLQYTQVHTWSVTDSCGNTASASQTVTYAAVDARPGFVVNGGVKGVIPASMSDMTVSCDAVPVAADSVSASDSCNNALEVVYAEARVDGSCPHTYLLVRTWTATDSCAVSSTVTQSITVQDTEAPQISGCPAPANVQCGSAFDLAVASTVAPVATDQCGESSMTVSQQNVSRSAALDCEFTYLRSWVFTDECGQSNTCTQSIVVYDDVSPVLEGVPSDVGAAQCSAPSAAVVTAVDSGNLGQTLSVSLVESTTPGSCVNEFVLVRTWSATDPAGNSVSAAQTITVDDTVAPSIVVGGVSNVAPAHATQECDVALPAAPVSSTTDNCVDVAPTLSYTAVNVSGSCADTYNEVRSWVSVDECSNARTLLQTIHVQDTTAPMLFGVPLTGTTVQCDAVPAAPQVTATDNCASSLVPVLTETVMATGPAPGTCPAQAYTISRVYSVADECGHVTSRSYVTTVQDTVAPTLLNTPAHVTVECLSLVPLQATTVSSSDNCDPAPSLVASASSSHGSSCGDGVTVYTWTATDACGNVESSTQSVTVSDTQAPVLATAVDVTSACVEPAVAVLAATDACGGEVAVTSASSALAGTQTCTHSFQRLHTWVAEDTCGNRATAVATVTVEDVTPPVLDSAPPAATVECSAVPTQVVLGATDVCAGDRAVGRMEVRENGQCANAYTLLRKWQTADDCQNAATELQTITVIDTTRPVFSSELPVDRTLECTANREPPSVSATDNCGAVAMTGPVISTLSATAAGCFVEERKWIATDNCGLTSTHTVTVTVEDTVAPVLSAIPNDSTVECMAEVPSQSSAVQVADACDEIVSVEQLAAVANHGDVCRDGSTVYAWSATDACGNLQTATQTVTVRDVTPPVLSFVPPDIHVQCLAQVGTNYAAVPLGTDACDGVSAVVTTEETIVGDCSGGSLNNFSSTRTFTATDACGNAATATQLVVVEDVTDPTFDNTPADETRQCELGEAPTVTASDNCGSPSLSLIADRQSTGTNCFRQAYTWVASDGCNEMSHTTTISVVDESAPALHGVPDSDTMLICDETLPDWPVVSATDNCMTPNVVNTSTPLRTCADVPYDIVRTWTAQDNCGNAVTATHTFHVVAVPTPAPTPAPTPMITCTMSEVRPSPDDTSFVELTCTPAGSSLISWSIEVQGDSTDVPSGSTGVGTGAGFHELDTAVLVTVDLSAVIVEADGVVLITSSTNGELASQADVTASTLLLNKATAVLLVNPDGGRDGITSMTPTLSSQSLTRTADGAYVATNPTPGADVPPPASSSTVIGSSAMAFVLVGVFLVIVVVGVFVRRRRRQTRSPPEQVCMVPGCQIALHPMYEQFRLCAMHGEKVTLDGLCASVGCNQAVTSRLQIFCEAHGGTAFPERDEPGASPRQSKADITLDGAVVEDAAAQGAPSRMKALHDAYKARQSGDDEDIELGDGADRASYTRDVDVYGRVVQQEEEYKQGEIGHETAGSTDGHYVNIGVDVMGGENTDPRGEHRSAHYMSRGPMQELPNMSSANLMVIRNAYKDGTHEEDYDAYDVADGPIVRPFRGPMREMPMLSAANLRAIEEHKQGEDDMSDDGALSVSLHREHFDRDENSVHLPGPSPWLRELQKREEPAAILIQAAYRGRRARLLKAQLRQEKQERQAQTDAAVILQAVVRGHSARRLRHRLIEEKKQHEAAIKIQVIARLLLARKNKAAVAIQSRVRGLQARRLRRHLVNTKAATVIQSLVRMWRARAQRRRLAEEKQRRTERDAATLIQCVVRRRAAQKFRRHLVEVNAAVKVQTVFRGYWARVQRRKLMEEKREQERAARRAHLEAEDRAFRKLKEKADPVPEKPRNVLPEMSAAHLMAAEYLMAPNVVLPNAWDDASDVSLDSSDDSDDSAESGTASDSAAEHPETKEVEDLSDQQKRTPARKAEPETPKGKVSKKKKERKVKRKTSKPGVRPKKTGAKPKAQSARRSKSKPPRPAPKPPPATSHATSRARSRSRPRVPLSSPRSPRVLSTEVQRAPEMDATVAAAAAVAQDQEDNSSEPEFSATLTFVSSEMTDSEEEDPEAPKV